MKPLLLRWSAAAFLVLGVAPVAVEEAPAAAGAGRTDVSLQPHQAAYVLTLKRVRQGSRLVNVKGALYFEVAQTCEGWSAMQHLRLDLFFGGGDAVSTDTRFTSWESQDGLSYRFDSQTRYNGELTEEIRGHAEIEEAGGPGQAVFTLPEDRTVDLPKGTIFPSAHTELLLERASAGERLVSRVVFDGATNDGPYQVTAVIGKGGTRAEEDVESPLVAGHYWPFTLAFFRYDSNQSEPDYELSADLVTNSIARSMEMDYGDFTVSAQLDELEILPVPECN